MVVLHPCKKGKVRYKIYMMEIRPRLTITEVLQLDTGQRVDVSNLLNGNQAEVFKLRTLVETKYKADEPLFACSTCGQVVGLRTRKLPSDKSHTFYFAHLHSSGNCPIKTGDRSKEEIQRMKYNGEKESDAHFELKHYIADQLHKDPRFSNIDVEKVVKGEGFSSKWKRPDVSASFAGMRVVFEIQLSTTFLSEIVSRELFYQQQKMPIFWVFKDLSPTSARATEKDVYFNNKANALSITEESKTLSRKAGQLLFTGHYMHYFYEPVTDNYQEVWDSKLISFDDFKFDPITKKPYFIDFTEQKKEAKQARHEKQFVPALRQLEKISFQDVEWAETESCLESLYGAGLLHQEGYHYPILKLIKALLSVRDGQVYFKNQNGNWGWLANYVYDNHLEHWVVFLYTIKKYERTKVVFGSIKDRHGKFRDKRNDFKSNWKHEDRFLQASKHYSLFSALLPEISNELTDVVKRYPSRFKD